MTPVVLFGGFSGTLNLSKIIFLVVYFFLIAGMVRYVAGRLRQRRNLALRIDLQIVVAVFQLLGAQIDLDQIVGKTGLEQRDMGGERAGAWRIIQFHWIFLPFPSLGNLGIRRWND